MPNLFKSLRPYARHKDDCASSRKHMCICGHRDNNHFDWGKKVCGHCKCEGFTVGECTCGITKLLKALGGKE